MSLRSIVIKGMKYVVRGRRRGSKKTRIIQGRVISKVLKEEFRFREM